MLFENLFGGGSQKKPAGAGINKPAIAPQIAPAPTAPAAPSVPAQPVQQAAATTQTGKDINVEVQDLRKDVDKIKDSVNALRGSLKSVTDKMEEIENSLSQLASVYELLANQMNPFLDEDEKQIARPKPKPETPPVMVPQPVPEKKEEEVVLPSVDLTNPKVIQTVLDWMEFLVSRVGHSGVEEVLKYYVDIKWISEEVAEVLKRYADGIRVDVEPEIATPVQLDPEDHMKSLDYILQIKEFQGKG